MAQSPTEGRADDSMERDIHFYQEAQLRNLLTDVRSVAAQKRLEAIFDVELFSFARTVEAVLAAPTRETGEEALREGKELLRRLREAPDKSSDDLLLR